MSHNPNLVVLEVEGSLEASKHTFAHIKHIRTAHATQLFTHGIPVLGILGRFLRDKVTYLYHIYF